jgi:hypothetical protein
MIRRDVYIRLAATLCIATFLVGAFYLPAFL